MDILRTRIKKDIVSEFVLPVKKSNRVVIMCTGMPGYPGRRRELMEFWAKKGYWVFLPRYRGTWESGGQFLKKSPHVDIADLMDEIPKGLVDLWSNKKYLVKNPQYYLIGSSFGGPAVLLNANDKRVKKIVALSPVIDFRVDSKVEPIAWLNKFMHAAFGEGYRYDDKDWKKMELGKIYNPATEIKNLPAGKVLIFHAKDDEIVPIEPTIDFVERLGCQLVTLKIGGHLSTTQTPEAKFWNKIKKHFK